MVLCICQCERLRIGEEEQTPGPYDSSPPSQNGSARTTCEETSRRNWTGNASRYRTQRF